MDSWCRLWHMHHMPLTIWQVRNLFLVLNMLHYIREKLGCRLYVYVAPPEQLQEECDGVVRMARYFGLVVGQERSSRGGGRTNHFFSLSFSPPLLLEGDAEKHTTRSTSTSAPASWLLYHPLELTSVLSHSIISIGLHVEFTLNQYLGKASRSAQSSLEPLKMNGEPLTYVARTTCV